MAGPEVTTAIPSSSQDLEKPPAAKAQDCSLALTVILMELSPIACNTGKIVVPEKPKICFTPKSIKLWVRICALFIFKTFYFYCTRILTVLNKIILFFNTI
jgi:hypothetical protein